ncbi:16S rRNA (uracil(1498)-N(3))-methyltransferase [Acinetobacter apis]|uniref:Ribosomal RNA small subunit methyltransferase E n=1 Tax=Acinetobacter apis TaxID=1229165 RepID=A0A217EHJ2_9GAMM|nr:16S rRNA (uracil(1498)-N(3))-methyltransferase [Acinetobacter apis]SNQ29979.1 RNA methyltransferase, RsmE family [Acinetobacter apis]
MNIILLKSQVVDSNELIIDELRHLTHIRTQLKVSVGDCLKVGIQNGLRYITTITEITETLIHVTIVSEDIVPEKHPVVLVLALPRPKVLRRLIMDSVTLGVEKIILIHSYRVDKSYWQSPFLNQLDDYIRLGLEQAGDTIMPEIVQYRRFKPFVEDVLSQVTAPIFVAHPYATERFSSINQPCYLVVGPEGGFIPYEIELLKANGCQTIQLGNRILRTETVIPYLLGHFQF